MGRVGRLAGFVTSQFLFEGCRKSSDFVIVVVAPGPLVAMEITVVEILFLKVGLRRRGTNSTLVQRMRNAMQCPGGKRWSYTQTESIT